MEGRTQGDGGVRRLRVGGCKRGRGERERGRGRARGVKRGVQIVVEGIRRWAST